MITTKQLTDMIAIAEMTGETGPQVELANDLLAAREHVDKLKDELWKERNRVSDLYQAVGIMATLKPTLEMDINHPVEMALEVSNYFIGLKTRIAELEDRFRWVPVSEKMIPENNSLCIGHNADDNTFFGMMFVVPEGTTHWFMLPEVQS